MKKYISILISILFILLPSCRSDEWVLSTTNPSDVSLYFSTRTPAAGQMTRAVEEELVSSVNILVFEGENGANYQFSYAVTGYSLTATNEGYDFFARIAYSENSVKLYLVANFAVNNITAGASEAEVKQALNGTYSSAGFDGALPMFGEVEFATGITENLEVDAVLVRSVARADVINTATNFTLTSVQIFRAGNQYQVIPNQLVNDIVTSPSLPVGTTQSVNTTQLAVTTTNSVEQLYLPEAPLVNSGGDQRLGVTVVVIGGRFEDDEDPTFYRLDFVPDGAPELFGQILRNHRYQFNIQTVLAPGWRTPQEAAEYYSSQIEVVVKEWNESTVNMVFDDVNYFGVSTRTLTLPYNEGAQGVISVDTSLDSYVLYWTDAGGVIDTIPPITLGESFNSADGRFNVEISGDGTQIIVTTNTVNDTGVQITDYLRAEAGRLRLQLTVIQDIFRIVNRPLNVFGSTTEIGSLGDYILGAGNTIPGDRARGMANIMLNPNHYGPSGIVPMQGINIGGRAGSDIFNPTLLELFDVVYLTYAQNPDATQINNILNWHRATNRRFLIIQFDNTRTTGSLTEASNTNYQMLNTLGLIPYITRINGIIQPYTLYEEAPEVITNGIFGPVTYPLQYRCYDDTYSVMDLDYALTNGISPVLLAQGGVLLGIDFNNRIIYSGDIDVYNNQAGGTGEYPSATAANPDVSGSNINAKRLIANMWAAIIDIVLAE